MSIKGKDFINESLISKDECNLCEVHKQAQKKFNYDIICPNCNTVTDFDLIESQYPVGETNTGNIEILKEEFFRNVHISTCGSCGEL